MPDRTLDASALPPCGDVIDRFPCKRCGARVPNECPDFERNRAHTMAPADQVEPVKRQWPNIGQDPMQGSREQYRGKPALDRLLGAYVLQQKEVPDQTALVWRCDLGYVLQELTRLNALAETQRAKLAEREETIARAAEIIRAICHMQARTNAQAHWFAMGHEFLVRLSPETPHA